MEALDLDVFLNKILKIQHDLKSSIHLSLSVMHKVNIAVVAMISSDSHTDKGFLEKRSRLLCLLSSHETATIYLALPICLL